MMMMMVMINDDDNDGGADDGDDDLKVCHQEQGETALLHFFLITFCLSPSQNIIPFSIFFLVSQSNKLWPPMFLSTVEYTLYLWLLVCTQYLC